MGGTPHELAELDFGKTRKRRPAVLLEPADTSDVALAVQFCARQGIPLAPRGCAHSAGAQMMVEQGFVIQMKSLNRIVEINAHSCWVEAGAQWGEVLLAVQEYGLTPPVVTDWLGVRVGGTLSMGGFGFMSFHRGTQMDNLLELEVVTGNGDIVRCSRDINPELFDCVRGTHGKFGLITRARILLEKAPSQVRMIQACYGDLRSMMHDFEAFTLTRKADLIHAFSARKCEKAMTTRMNSTDRMNLDPETVQAALQRIPGEWIYNLELVELPDANGRTGRISATDLRCESGLVDTWELSWKAFCFRLPPLILEEQHRGAAPHPEICTFLPLNELSIQYLEREYSRLRPIVDIGDGPVLFFPVTREWVGAPLFRLPESPKSFFWGLLRRADPATPEKIAAQLADNEVIYQRVLELGGVRYLPDTPPEDPAFWSGHFGPLWPRIQEWKRKYDSKGILISSFGAAAQE